MKKLKFIIFIAILFLTLICFKNVVRAESELYLNNLEFVVEVNSDASITVKEYWDIDIGYTNTLYKSFKKDNSKYTGITDVKVSDLTGGRVKGLTKQSQWEYHVNKGKYYGANNEQGDFEIGWGVGLDNDIDTRKYEIEYTVQNAITKYNDYAELYWQLLGDGFGIPANKIIGTIILPPNPKTKEDIKVWGHTEDLNGTIYVTDSNKIEFEVNNYRGSRMLEIRTLFPTEMIIDSARIYEEDILQTVVEEETRWAEEANQRREAIKNSIVAIVAIAGLIIDIIFIITIINANKSPYKKQKRYVPEQKLEYYRDIPRKNATPGQACNLLQKNMYDTLNYDNLGKIFSAILLNLKLKGYLEFEIDETKSKKERISIKMVKKENAQELIGEEKDVYTFLDQATLRKEGRILTLKELQKIIKSSPSKIEKLDRAMGKNIYNSLIQENLLDEKQAKDHSSNSGIAVIQIVFLVLFLLFAFIMSMEIQDIRIMSIMIISTLLGIVSITKKIVLTKRINPYTQNGVNEIEAWKGLKKYMEHFSLLNEREVLEIEIWERFLVYATAFGIADKVIEQLKIAYPNFEEITGTNYSMMYLMMNTDFNNSFSSAISSSVSSAYSSGSGAGGGFSGGGGGGGGRWWWRWTLTL